MERRACWVSFDSSMTFGRCCSPSRSLPGIGNLFSYRDDAVRKSELVLFLRPTVIRSAGVGAPAVARAALPTSLDAPGLPSLVRQP